MSDKIILEPYNGVHDRIFTTNEGIERELAEHFSFFVPGYKFMPAYKNGWDGKIRLYNKKNIIYAGLADEVRKFCEKNKYTLVDYPRKESIPEEELRRFISLLKLPSDKELRDYQFNATLSAINNRRMVIESSVGSGKSLMIYILSRWYSGRILIIVPTVNLVHQLGRNFNEYGCDIPVHKIHYGQEKNVANEIVISTWQSLITLDESWFLDFENVIVDETHLAQAKSLKRVLESCTNAYNRVGLTGSMKDTLSHRMVIEGLLGATETHSTARDLIDRGFLAPMSIKCIIFEHIPRKFDSYPDEIKFITTSSERNNFIIKLASKLKGNTLVLFNYEEQGLILKDLAEKISPNVYYVQGKVRTSHRDEIFQAVKTEENCILVASEKTTGIGIDIPSLDNIILASPSKSREKLIQAMGRVIRKNGKNATVYDLADNFGGNHTIRHFKVRTDIYKRERHIFSIKKIKGML